MNLANYLSNSDKLGNSSRFADEYEGKSFINLVRFVAVMTIPVKIRFEIIDAMGDTLACNDSDANNNGSGSLDKGESYQDNFRINEALDIPFTKFHDNYDNSPFSIGKPEKE